MSDASYRWCLRSFPITEEWMPVSAAIHCNSIKMTADVQFRYCSDKDLAAEGMFRGVGSLIDADIGGAIGARDSSPRFVRNASICYVRAESGNGTIWIQYLW